jgi:transcription termination factor Rho
VADLKPSFFYTSNYESHKNINPKRVPQTCSWFLEHPTFQKWRASSSDELLWLSADPGCGKSVLSRALIDEKLVSTGSFTLCYFFFKDNDEQNNIATALCALLHQLFWKNEKLCHKYIAPAIKKCGEALKRNFEELWRTFVSVATDPSAGNVVCILDALDECQESDRDKLINRLEDFYCRHLDEHERESRLKFLVTSRPYSDIERGFSELTRNIPTIRLAGEDESEMISQEIGIVIEAKVREIAERCRLSDPLCSALRKVLCEIPNRTYLWLHLTLDEVKSKISKGKTETKLLSLINTLPRTVEDAYEKILANCDQEEARKILHILVTARRPLTVSELDVALEVDPDSTSWELERQYGDRKESIRETCGLFVSIVGSRVYLIHQTAREFLICKSVGSSEPQRWKHSINLREGNRLLSEKCVAYLLFYESQTNTSLTQVGTSSQYMQSVLKAETQEHPFLEYAAIHWISHVQEARFSSTDWISRTTKLCDIGDGLSCTWFNIYSNSTIAAFSTRGMKRIPLHWGVVFGLVNETRYLLESSMDCDDSEFSTQEIFVDAAKSKTDGRELIEIFLHRRGDKVKITEQVVEAAAGNSKGGMEIMVFLLDRQRDDVTITQRVVEAAARNWESGKEIMALLLDRRVDGFDMSPESVAAVAESFDERAIASLLDWRGDEITITAQVVEAAAQNMESGEEIMALLLDRRVDGFDMSPETVAAIVQSFDRRAITSLLNQRGDEVTITERVVEAAACNWQSGKEIMALLLDQRAHGFDMLPESVATVVRLFDKRAIAGLLDQRGDEVKITEQVVEAATKNLENGKEIMALLLDRRADGFDMLPESVATVVRLFDKRAITSLLDQRGDEVKITERVVEAAAKNTESGEEIMALLFDRRGNEVNITAHVVKAAAENWESGKEIMTLLLGRRRDEVKITEQVVIAAAENSKSGKEIMALFFDQRVDGFDMLPETVGAVARLFNKSAIASLLERRGDEVNITAQVLEAAAKNMESGEEIMAALVDWQGDEVQITEQVITAAAENKRGGKEIMTLLLDRRATRAQLQRLLVTGLGISEQLGPSLFRIRSLGAWIYLRF